MSGGFEYSELYGWKSQTLLIIQEFQQIMLILALVYQ